MKRFLLAVMILVCLVSASYAQSTLSLDDCINEALKNNPQLKTAEAQYGMAKAGRLNAWSGILPNISFSATPERSFRSVWVVEELSQVGQAPDGSYLYDKVPRKYRSAKEVDYSVRVNYRQNIWDTGRWWNSIRGGNAQARAGEYGFQNSVIQTVLNVKERYYNLLKVQEQKGVLQEAVEVAEEQLRNSQNMFEIGTVAQVDVYRSRVNLNNNQIILLNHDLQIEDAKNQLNMAMGRDVGTPIDINGTVPFDVNYTRSLDDMLLKGTASHPQIKQLENQLMSSEMNLKVAKSSRFPTVSAYATYFRSNNVLERVTGDLNQNYSLATGITLNFNVFDGFQTRSNVQRAKHQTNIDEENLRNNKYMLQSNIRNSYLQLQQFRPKLEISQEMVESAAEELRLENERYRVGTGTLIETIQAQSSYRNARFQLVQMQYDAKIAEARLNAAAGNLNSGHLSVVKK